MLAVNPGWSGQSFIPATAVRIAALREQIVDRDILLGVDDGVTRENASYITSLGADLIVAGSAVFAGDDLTGNARLLLTATRSALKTEFAGRAAIVTGAVQGIGQAICQRLLEEGAAGVVAFDLNPSTRSDERCVPFVADVSDSQAAADAVQLCLEWFGQLDLMAAHAGIAEPRPLLESHDQHWEKHMRVNVDGVLYCVREAARAMVDRGTSGAIVCTASINAWHVEQTMAAYSVSRLRSLQALARRRSTSAIAESASTQLPPGVVDTPLAALVVHNPELAPTYLRTIPLGRFGQPRDIAEAVLFLASAEASRLGRCS